VLWTRAPFVLRLHPGILFAVVVTAFLTGLAAASAPFVRAGVRSESLRAQVRLLSPLAAGLEVNSGGSPEDDRSRRAGAVRFRHGLPAAATPVMTSLFPADVAGAEGNGLQVVAMARTGAVAHVHHVSAVPGGGVWISTATAKTMRLRAGGTIGLTQLPSRTVVRFRIAGVYRALDSDVDNPYWANFVQDIRAVHVDAPPRPAFVLMPEQTLVRLAERLRMSVENRFEFPVRASTVTYTEALRLRRVFAEARREVGAGRSVAARALGCGAPYVAAGAHVRMHCETHTAVDATLRIAAANVAGVAPTISLLSGSGIALAFALTVAAGVFLVRRRADEVFALHARGESPVVFAARAGVEALAPVLVGVAAGVAVALFALRGLAPAGTIDGDTVRAGVGHALAAGTLAVLAVAVGALLAFPRRPVASRRFRAVARLPWELVPLAAAGAAVATVLAGSGLVRDRSGVTHPSFAVFLVPVVAAAAATGLTVRLVRRLVARRGADAVPPVFLALRRIGAARSLLVAVAVGGAAAFGAFAYALTLSRSLERGAAEKAFVANGSDVQGYVDPGGTIDKPFPFPVALVQVDSLDVSLPDGRRIDLLAADPQALRRTLRWGDGWPGDPRPLLPRLRASSGPLPALATTDAPTTDAIVDQGVRIGVRIVGHAILPGTTAGRPALLVSRAALARVATRARILDPGPGAVGLIWARGSPARIASAFGSSTLAPAYLTTPAHIRDNGSVVAAERSFRYVRAIGVVAAALSLVALLLYLQARQRSQRIATALAQRMGLTLRADVAALALEAGFVVLLAAAVGGLVAVAVAQPVIAHVDPLPLYAPPPVTVVPWLTLVVTGAVVTAVGSLFGAAAGMVAARSDVAEALRVA
jgi:putative ABC transport system permease protein